MITIGVIIPNYNHARYIKECLEGVLGQSYPPHQVWVIDDASTDHSLEVLEPYVTQKKIQLIQNSENKGVNYNMQLGLEKSNCTHLFYHAADDFILHGFFEAAHRAFTEHPSAAVFTTDPGFYDQTLQSHIGENGFEKVTTSTHFFSPLEARTFLNPDHFWMATHASMIQKQALEKAGGFDSELKWHSDWYVYHKAALTEGIVYEPGTYSIMRVQKESYATTGKRNTHDEKEILKKIILKSKQEGILEAFVKSKVIFSFKGYQSFLRDEINPKRKKNPIYKIIDELDYQMKRIPSRLERIKNHILKSF